MDTEERPEYRTLTKSWRLKLFDGKRKYLFLSFRLFRRLDKFQWLGLEFNRYPSCEGATYLDFTLFSMVLSIGIHRGTYNESVKTGG